MLTAPAIGGAYALQTRRYRTTRLSNMLGTRSQPRETKSTDEEERELLLRYRSIGGPMSDRNVIVTTVFIAGLMLGAFTVQLKDQISLHLGTLGFNSIMQCAATGP